MADPQVKIVVSAVDKASAQINNITKTTGSMAKGLLTAAAGAVGFGMAVGKATEFIKGSITAASNLGETVNKTKVIFGKAADAIIDKSDDVSESMGMSSQSFLDAASTFGVFGKSAGLADEGLAKFSTDLTGLAADMASFSNTSPEEAILAIGAALRGESEPIRRYGVLLDDASLRQQALEMGIISTTKNALTPQQRVLAAQALIFKQTSDAQGDFARTSEGLANTQKILKAETENLKVELGTALIPTVTLATQGFVDFVQNLNGTYDAAKHAEDGLSDLDDFMKKFNTTLTMAKAADVYVKYVESGIISTNRNIKVQKEIAGVWNDNEKVLAIYNREISGYLDYSKSVNRQDDIRRRTTEELAASIVWFDKGQRDMVKSTAELAREAKDAADALGELALAEIHAGIEASNLNNFMSDLDISINGALGPTIEDFTISQAELTQKMADTQAEIDKLIAEGYNPTSEKVLGLKGEYDELKDQYTANEQEHDRATKEIMFDMAEQEAAMGGLTKAEGDMLKILADKWGLPYQATIDYQKKAEEAIRYLADSGDAEGAAAILAGQATAWGLAHGAAIRARDAAAQYREQLDLLDGKVVNTYINTFMQEFGQEHNMSSGANFVVPPGYPNDSYHMNVESGEHVVVVPKGGTTTNNSSFTMNVHTNAPYSTLMSDYYRMKAMAG